MYNCQIGLHWRNNYSKKKRMKIWLFYLASIWKTIYGLVWFSLVIKSLFITSLMTSIFIQHTTSGVNYAIILRMVALICSVRLSLPRRWKIHSRQRDYHHSEYSAPLPPWFDRVKTNIQSQCSGRFQRLSWFSREWMQSLQCTGGPRNCCPSDNLGPQVCN